ncbi:MAG: N-6 DNA methylase [bacterium]
MINQSNFKELLQKLGFDNDDDIFKKVFQNIDAYLTADFNEKKLIYPEDKFFKVNERQICNFSSNENFIVFECVYRLFEKGYKPKHIELEPRWQVGHGASGGRADIMVKNNSDKPLLIIECKTPGKEFINAWKDTINGKGQLFTYVNQERSVEFICLYTSDLDNETVKYQNHIILVQDKGEILKLKKNESPLSYKESTTSSELFQTWKKTYESDFYTKGIFEYDIQPYQIGKTKYAVNDLQKVTQNDIQPKYHEFATILRQHNISGRENAFDKLVNLFLCKVVDEKNNPDDLQFYWRGIAYDSYFDLIDRLQRLYRDGMAAFLKEKVTYIDNQTIYEAFNFVKNDPDATRDKVLEYFRQQKYFTNNDFSFLDVHNEKLFYQNTEVLLKIVRMLQDIRLNGNQQNQFLGDFFEGFLDQGIKQTEGQFFTPLPITRFIISSLPMKNILQNDKPPYIIDYACGAGHFLTEIASQIRKEKDKTNEEKLKNYYRNIYGIEKEYRLSKVAKVSSFMYNQDEINIIYADALAQHKNIKNNYFDILISNPPYSVKGFLETLSENDRKQFELIKAIDTKSYPGNNSIETFFIERTKQLLKQGGIAAIIVPSSILTKGKSKNVYMATREILLKYFDMVAIIEFGSGTFSKTGTNTVTLFLRKKNKNPEPSIHYLNRINSWFNDSNDRKDKKSSVFEDNDYINAYCNHLGISFDDYKTLLEGEPNDVLLQIDIFQDYNHEFKNSSEIKNLKKQHNFKALTEEKQKAELQKRFIDYVKEIEKEKLYYFILAFQNPQPVLIIKSPSITNEIKEFLGYEWSKAKGNEGIKYLTTGTNNIIQGNNEYDNESESEHVVQNFRDLDNILTPLYDPHDKLNHEKINTLIVKNFNGEDFKIPEYLQKYVSKSELVDMIDFNRTEFNKIISLTPKKNISLKTKWNTVRLGEIIKINPKSTIQVNKANDNFTYPFFTSGKNIFSFQDYLVDGENIYISTGGKAVVNFYDGKAAYSTDTLSFTTKTEKTMPRYLFIILNLMIEEINNNMFEGMALKHLQKNKFDNIKIPMPELDIQNQIIAEYNCIDKEVGELQKNIEFNKKKIEDLFIDASVKAETIYKLSDKNLFDISIGQRVLKYKLKPQGKIPVFSANIFEPFGYTNELLIKDFSKPSVVWGIDGDWMVRHVPANIRFYPTDHCGVIRIKNDKVFAQYLTWILRKEGENMRLSRHNRASIDKIKAIIIKVPKIEVQKQMDTIINLCEIAIEKSQETIKNITKKKEDIIKKYL